MTTSQVNSEVQQIAKAPPNILAIVETKRMHNSTSRINRLPVEILTAIFQLSQTSRYSNENIFPPPILSSDSGVNDWLKILRVCHEWRRVALATPSLWKNIYTTDRVKDLESLTEWFLHNAGALVLISWKINLNYVIWEQGSSEYDYVAKENGNLSNKFLDTFAANLHRIESLSIQCASNQPLDSAESRLFELVTGPMPSLQALDMRIPCSNNVVFPALGVCGITHLSTYALPLPNVNFARLSHLSLEHQELGTRPSLKLFLDFLKASPSLEMLRLKDAGPVLSLTDLKNLGYPPEVIELPHLRRIQYEISETDVMAQSDAFYWILVCMDVPEDSTVHLASPKLPTALRCSKQMYAALGPYFNRISSVKLMKVTSCIPGNLLFHGTRLYVEVPLTTTFFQAKGGPYSKIQTLILAENTNKLSASKIQFLLKSFPGLQRIEAEWEHLWHIRVSEHPVVQALSGMNIRSKKLFAVGDLPCGDLQELVLKSSSFKMVFGEGGKSLDAQYDFHSGKISRSNGLLYALKQNSRTGPLPLGLDRSFAGSGFDMFASALQSGDFRYL